jgi:hypothetical protein
MDKRRLILKWVYDRVYFNPELSIAITQTNMPHDAMGFNPNIAFFWAVEMVRFEDATQTLHVSVASYDAAQKELFELQKPKKTINNLVFEGKFDWEALQPQLSFFKKAALLPVLIHDESAQTTPQPTRNFQPDLSFSSVLKLDFKVDFTAIHFGLGSVTFQHHIPALNQTLDFTISNDHLLPEFDYIKPWFAKKIGKREISVRAQIHFLNGNIQRCEATSKEIAAINNNMVDLVKQQRTLNIT